MNKTIGAVALLLAFLPFFAHSAESIGTEVQEAKTNAVKAKRTAGKQIRHTGRKARQAVITRCADGRHTIKGASGCVGHGGVRDPR